MPHLTSFTSLAVVIFAAVFLICYLFSRPTQIIGKMAALGSSSARATPQSQVLVRELSTEVRSWRIGLQEILCKLSQQPEAASADFRAQLDATLERLEKQIEKAVAGVDLGNS